MICPDCGKSLENITFIKFEEFDCRVYASYKGSCPICKKEWCWEDIYEYLDSTIMYEANDH